MSKQKSKWLDFGTGSQQIHADKLPVDYAPSNYSPDATGSETLDKLSAHLKGIDTAIRNVISSAGGYYDASIFVNTDIGVAGVGYNADHTIFTLPGGELYNGTIDELEVLINGVHWEDGVHFNYENSDVASTVTMLVSIPKNSRVRFRKIKRDALIYDSSVLVTTEIGVPGVGYNDAHTIFTLPGGETYDGNSYDLLVFLNGVSQEDGIEITYGEGGFATTVTFLIPVPIYSRVRFRKVRF